MARSTPGGGTGYGQVGTNSTAYQVRSPALVLTGAVDIGAGHYSSFAVKADGTLWAWA